MKSTCLVIGGGLSGLAAAIRLSRYCPEVLILEQHSRLGGLNSYYYRHGRLLETGLHAVTNYTSPKDKKAPINKLLRQLGIRRGALEQAAGLCQQLKSQIRFPDAELFFSNNHELLMSQVGRVFPDSYGNFARLADEIRGYNPFTAARFRSAKAVLLDRLKNPLLAEMLLCPLCFYGSSVENDMDYNQFVIMFKSIFLEGMFRPGVSIKEFIQFFADIFKENGGRILFKTKVVKIHTKGRRAVAAELENGEMIEADHIISTAGYEETLKLLGRPGPSGQGRRLGFLESIFLVPPGKAQENAMLPRDKTIIFYNNNSRFNYRRPDAEADFTSGVICFPQNFENFAKQEHFEIRLTHLANYHKWQELYKNRELYNQHKREAAAVSARTAGKIVGDFSDDIVYQDTFTPVTIERYTAKKEGAIYGSPAKFKDGDIGCENLFLAGTDQGFLGIIGSMLSGVSIANQHLLPKI
ncbi:MAG: phytoene dehydrogenase [Deltaproteobacteria bacterium]|nr:MAG: phytoene dehydrogenase [Deltaproteobacteria bacterium]